jgi:hypothetical protein
VPTWQGFVYLAVVLDVFSRRIVGWAMAEHMRTELVTDALAMALHQRQPRDRSDSPQRQGHPSNTPRSPSASAANADKAATRERVLRIASRKIRAEGVTRPGIADLMKEAGLTHGGFYKHFASRDDLIAQAAVIALAEGSAKMERAARKNEQNARAGLIDAYLAKQHRDRPVSAASPDRYD